MTQKDKLLLLKDLCARFPYGVMIQRPELFNSSRMVVEKMVSIDDLWRVNDDGIYIEHIKPYLRPMSSMTEEEELMLKGLMIETDDESYMSDIDWLNKNMFDYRGLIEKGLAIAVTEQNNPYK